MDGDWHHERDQFHLRTYSGVYSGAAARVDIVAAFFSNCAVLLLVNARRQLDGFAMRCWSEDSIDLRVRTAAKSKAADGRADCYETECRTI